jgi:SP family myo-inositol transporter-like MFS transporter 13
MITLGQVIAYGIGAGFFHVKSGWRWMVGLGAIPAGIQFLFLFVLPESRTCLLPFLLDLTNNQLTASQNGNIARILLHRGNIGGAREIMRKIYAHATPENIDLKVQDRYLVFFEKCLT